MTADTLFIADLEKAIKRYKANGGTDADAVKILRATADRLTAGTAAVVDDTQPDDPLVPVTNYKRRKPNKARIAKKATATARSRVRAVRRTIFDTFKLPDGTPIGEVEYHELPALARLYSTASHVCWAIYHHVQPPATNQPSKVRDLIGEDFLEQAVKDAEGARDVLAA